MRVAAIDFKKAFESHDAMWRSLRNHSISEQYTCLLKKLYADQCATLLTDLENDEFRIGGGTKQVDLLSSLLFKSVLQSALEQDIETWIGKGLGIKLSDEKRDCISDLRFADDVLMMATSLQQLKRMIADKGSKFTQRRR